jgi:hypothetical protein
MGEKRYATDFRVKYLKERDNLEDQGVNVWIILQLSLRNGRAWCRQD